MKDFIITNIVALIAVLISFITVWYTRKNLKTKKYIETITQQRILWISTLRADFSLILAQTITLKYCHEVEINDREVGYPGEDNDPENIAEYGDFVKNKNREKIDREQYNFQTISRIELSILRLNDNDDSKLIETLEKIKIIYLNNYYYEITDELIVELRNNIKKLLKKEWEKVKLETKKGKLAKK